MGIVVDFLPFFSFSACNYIKQETPVQLFSGNFFEFYQKTFPFSSGRLLLLIHYHLLLVIYIYDIFL